MKESMEYKVVSAISFIEANLCNDISRDDIASEACLSLRQLYRIFYQGTGDSLVNYLRMRRLTEASRELIYSKVSATDLAFKYQFKSLEVFSRAFIRSFWNSPSHFRKIGSAYTAKQRCAIDGRQFSVIGNGNLTSPDLIDLPERHYVGFQTVQPHYGFKVEDNVSEGVDLTDLLSNHRHSLHGVRDESIWNIAFLRKSFLMAHEIENLYAIEVEKKIKIPDELSYFLLPACRYARFIHHGDEDLIVFTLSLAFQWLEQSPYFLGDAPSLSRITSGVASKIEIYLPISDCMISQTDWWGGYSSEYLLRVSGFYS